MRSSTIRLIVPLALLAIVGIIATQTYWIRRIYHLQEQSFRLATTHGLRSAATEVMRLRGSQPPAVVPVETIGPGTLAVPIGVPVEHEVLEHYLHEGLAAQGLVTDFSYAIYDCSANAFGATGYHDMDGKGDAQPSYRFPKIQKSSYYFAVHFPRRAAMPLSEIMLWALCAVVLLGVVTFLCYLLYIIFRQRRLSEIQKDFLQNMTHEFRTPLSTIQLSAEVLKNPAIVNSPTRLQQYAGIIAAESAALSAQVGRALHMYQMGKGEMQYVREPIVWQDLLRDAAAAFEGVVADRGGSLQLIMPEAPVTGVGDRRHLLNTVAAVIDNAVKYTERAPAVFITLEAAPGGRNRPAAGDAGAVRVHVQDNGIGISDANQKRIFRKFYRVPTGNVHDVKGFGLGLSYVEETVRAHGGEVACKSAITSGTTFTLTFPLSASNSTTATATYAGHVQGQNPPGRG